jgi:adenylate cyclase
MDVETENREPTAAAVAADQKPEEVDHWRALLTGEDPGLKSLRRRMKLVPNGPRCKVCAAPFHGPGRILTRLMFHGQSVVNPTMCQLCFRQLSDHPGGAEVDISIVFADIRGSTALAESIGAVAFRGALQRFYGIATKAIEHHGGYIDKYLGDGVMALFIPVMAGEAHAARALAAGLELVASVEHSSLPGSGVRVGAGVHHGSAFVGVLGSGEKLDFSALGDAVNVAARLGAIAGPGEVIASRDAWAAAGRDSGGGETRRVELTGRHEPLDVVVVQPAAVPA